MFQTTNQLYNLEETCETMVLDLVAVSPNEGASCNVFFEPILGCLDFPLYPFLSSACLLVCIYECNIHHAIVDVQSFD